MSEHERVETAKLYVDMGVPVRTVLERVVQWSEADLAALEAEQAAQSERDKETLAAAVLNAQAALDSGEGSNGAEQPGDRAGED